LLGTRTGEENVVSAAGFEFSISACSRSLCWQNYTRLGFMHAFFKGEEEKNEQIINKLQGAESFLRS